jgi:cephalosporin hydroxylase
MFSRIFHCHKKSSGDFPIANPKFAEFEINNWVLSEFIVDHLCPIVGVHPYPLNELLLMTGALCRLQPDHLFEWGTHMGKSARIFFETCQYFHLKTVIHSVDLPPDATHEEHPGQEYAKFLKGIQGVKLYRGDGLDVAAKMARSFASSASLMFFLDGDHSFESVSRELQTITSTFPFASILIHDTFYQDPACGYNIGPYQAIQQLLGKVPSRYQLIETRTGLPGMSLLIPS